MEAYIYQADIYCKDCGRAIRRKLTHEGQRPEHWKDERTYDSADFPKGPYTDGGGESDHPEHCAMGEKCLNALVLSNGIKVGCWLENPLTPDGVEYVREALLDGGEVAELWAKWYAEELSHASNK